MTHTTIFRGAADSPMNAKGVPPVQNVEKRKATGETPVSHGQCGRLQQRLTEYLVDRLDLPGRMRRHIEQCPRCRRRAITHARVGLALRLIRTQPHSMNLLLEANRRAIAMLQRGVRELPQAQSLRTKLPRAPWRIRLAAVAQAAASAATCLTVLLAARAGVLSSLTRLQEDGRHAAEAYCSRLDQAAGENLAPGDRHAKDSPGRV